MVLDDDLGDPVGREPVPGFRGVTEALVAVARGEDMHLPDERTRPGETICCDQSGTRRVLNSKAVIQNYKHYITPSKSNALLTVPLDAAHLPVLRPAKLYRPQQRLEER